MWRVSAACVLSRQDKRAFTSLSVSQHRDHHTSSPTSSCFVEPFMARRELISAVFLFCSIGSHGLHLPISPAHPSVGVVRTHGIACKVDLSKLTKRTLKGRLKKAGLKVSGSKADLIERLSVWKSSAPAIDVGEAAESVQDALAKEEEVPAVAKMTAHHLTALGIVELDSKEDAKDAEAEAGTAVKATEVVTAATLEESGALAAKLTTVIIEWTAQLSSRLHS